MQPRLALELPLFLANVCEVGEHCVRRWTQNGLQPLKGACGLGFVGKPLATRSRLIQERTHFFQIEAPERRALIFRERDNSDCGRDSRSHRASNRGNRPHSRESAGMKRCVFSVSELKTERAAPSFDIAIGFVE